MRYREISHGIQGQSGRYITRIQEDIPWDTGGYPTEYKVRQGHILQGYKGIYQGIQGWIERYITRIQEYIPWDTWGYTTEYRVRYRNILQGYRGITRGYKGISHGIQGQIGRHITRIQEDIPWDAGGYTTEYRVRQGDICLLYTSPSPRDS